MATDEELASIRRRLLGLIAEERIRTVRFERPDTSAIKAFLSLSDLSSTVADALDALGVGGAAAASVLAPRAPGARLCGPAITIRYVPESGGLGSRARGEAPKLADRDLYGIGQPGDVAVFDCGGYCGASVMGGLSARWARRLEIAGCVVDGAVRDLQTIRDVGVPVWSSAITPVSGKHRLEAIEINGVVAVAGLRVRPGDLIAADETGVCAVPRENVEDVPALCLRAGEGERSVVEAIEGGLSAEEIVGIVRPDQW